MNTLAFVDSAFERAYDELGKIPGFMDNALFVILGDHGESFGAHGHKMHGKQTRADMRDINTCFARVVRL